MAGDVLLAAAIDHDPEGIAHDGHGLRFADPERVDRVQAHHKVLPAEVLRNKSGNADFDSVAVDSDVFRIIQVDGRGMMGVIRHMASEKDAVVSDNNVADWLFATDINDARRLVPTPVLDPHIVDRDSGAPDADQVSQRNHRFQDQSIDCNIAGNDIDRDILEDCFQDLNIADKGNRPVNRDPVDVQLIAIKLSLKKRRPRFSRTPLFSNSCPYTE